MFTQEGKELGCTSIMYHRIHTEDDLPVDQRHRCILPNQFEEVKEHLQDLLEKGDIKPSQSNCVTSCTYKSLEPFAFGWINAHDGWLPSTFPLRRCFDHVVKLTLKMVWLFTNLCRHMHRLLVVDVSAIVLLKCNWHKLQSIV